MSGGGFHPSEIVGHFKGLEWPSTVYGGHFLRVCLPFEDERGRKSLAENFRFQRWCLFRGSSCPTGRAAPFVEDLPLL